MSIVLTGAEGQLGKTIQAFAKSFEIPIHAFARKQCDINDPLQLENVFNGLKPRFLINAAAFAAVDQAETAREQALQVNGYACEHLAKACKKYSTILLHFSTDYVFDGETEAPYTETAHPNPLNAYGQSKHLGDQLIQQNLDSYIILRVAWLFSEFGNNFLKTILKLAKTEETLKVVDDQHGCPTSTWHIAEVLFRMINQLKKDPSGFGVYHYADQPATTWFGFTQKIIEAARKVTHLKVKEVLPVSSSAFPRPAKRPKNSVFDCAKIEKAFHVNRLDWSKDLDKLIRRIGVE